MTEHETPYPFAAHIGMRLVSWTPDFARLELTLEPFTGNRHGMPHGGIHASLLDTCMGYAGCHSDDPAVRRYCLTLNLSVNYLSRPSGDLLIAEGHRTGGGARTFFAEGRVKDKADQVIATGTGVFRYRALS